MPSFTLNDKPVSIEADPKTPLLWVIRDHVGLTGTKYGCGAGLCGACTIHIDGTAQRSCQIDVGSVAGKRVLTIEGLSATSSHPLQKAWVVEEVPQCGYCQSGQIMKAAELLAKNPKPSRADIITHERQYLPLRNLSPHHRRHRARSEGGLSHDDDRYDTVPPQRARWIGRHGILHRGRKRRRAADVAGAGQCRGECAY